MKPPRTHRAFTIVELIAVLVLTAITGLVAVGSLASLATSRQANSARTIQRDLTFARERAMATSARHWVVFDTAIHSYSILSESPPYSGYATAATLTDPSTGSPLVVRLNREEHVGVTFATVSFDGGLIVGFDHLGRPVAPSLVRVDKLAQVELSSGAVISVDFTTGAATLALP